jgi:hypothetical protein
MKTLWNTFLTTTLCFLALLATKSGYGQKVIATGGAYATTEQGSLNWTIGEPVIATGITAEAILSQGYHQPLLMATSTKEINRKSVALKLYPNPSHAQLNIELRDTSADDFEAVLYSPDGHALKRQRLDFDATHIMDLRSLPAGAYQLSVFRNHELQESFTIIKF